MNKFLPRQIVRRRPMIAAVLALSLFAQTGQAGIPIFSSMCRNILEKLNKKSPQTRDIVPLKTDEVNELVEKYRNDPQSFDAFEYDLRRRMTTGDFTTSEVFAAAILNNDRAADLWKNFELVNKNVYVGWNFLSFSKFVPSQRSRVIAERQGIINPFIKKYEVLFPPKVPLEIEPLVTSLFAKPQATDDYRRLLESTTDVMAKVTAGQNKLYVLQRVFSNIIALPIGAWELFRNIAVATDAGFKINTPAPKLVGYRFLIRVFEHDPIQRKQLLETTRWYLEDPNRLSLDAPTLTPAQQMILQDKGFDGLMNDLIKNKGMREAAQFFNRTYPWFLGIAITAIGKILIGGSGAAFNGKNHKPDKNACLPTAEYDQAINNYDFYPFDDVFIKIEGTTDRRTTTYNPCDPKGEILREYFKLQEKYPIDPNAEEPYQDAKLKIYEGTSAGQKEMRLLQNIIRDAYQEPNSKCRIHYAQVISCGVGAGHN